MPKPYASLIIKLLQAHALYDDDMPYWQLLQDHEVAVRAYFEQIGVRLDVNREDGYARLTQPAPADDDPTPPPLRLLRRIGLTYEQSLLAVVLREWLEEHEQSAHTTTRRLWATRAEIRERVELFFQQPTNRKAWLGKLDGLIEHLVKHGLLKELAPNDTNPDQTKYEVKALLKAKISLEKLEEFKEKLQRHVESTEPLG